MNGYCTGWELEFVVSDLFGYDFFWICDIFLRKLT